MHSLRWWSTCYCLLQCPQHSASDGAHLTCSRSDRSASICGGARRTIASCEFRSFRLQCTLRQLLWQSSSPGRCGVTLADCCCGSRDVAASHSHTAVAAAETLRRHTRRLLLRQQRRCGVTFAHCCCGSRDVAASHSHTAVAAAETLRRHTLRLLLRQQSAPSPAMSYASRAAGVIKRRKRQLLRLLPRGALWPNVALKKPDETMLRPRSKSPQLWPGLIGL